MNLSRVPKSASHWALLMVKLRKMQPRPITKLYGKKGPTPEQKERWDAEMKRWNRVFRAVSKEQKRALARDNENYRKSAEMLKKVNEVKP